MKLQWTSKALSDLARLYEFLAPVNKRAAARTVQALTVAPAGLLTNQRIGEQLFEFEQREVRRLLVGHYEMRYEVRDMSDYLIRKQLDLLEWAARVIPFAACHPTFQGCGIAPGFGCALACCFVRELLSHIDNDPKHKTAVIV